MTKFPNLEKIATWRSRGDKFYLCMTCRYCLSETYEYLDGEDKSAGYQTLCPVFELWNHEAYSSFGKVSIARALYEGKMDLTDKALEIIYACPVCGACREECFARRRTKYYELHGAEPSPFDPMEMILALRRDAVELGKGPLPIQKRWAKEIVERNNPYFEKHEARLDWLSPAIRKELPKKADTVYYVGCTSSYRQQNIARATVEILEKSGENYTIMFPEEWCCGSPAYMTGQMDLFRRQLQHNVEAAKNYGAKKLVTSCAGCYRMWKKEYPEALGEDLPFEVLHSVEFIHRLLKNGKISLQKEIAKEVTYHDPCHIGRHLRNGGNRYKPIFEEPREVLKAIPGIKLKEMPRKLWYSYCCAAGGGFKSAFRREAVEIAARRVQEAIPLNVDALVSTCPFCYRNFQDAKNEKKFNIEIYDLTELVAQSIG
jgi:heterodisulfide reductase subunit D